MKEKLVRFYKSNFIYKNKQELSIKSFIILTILNLLVFFLVLKGIDSQINNLNKPNERFSNLCREVFNSKSLTDINNNFYENRLMFIKFKNIDNRCKVLIGEKLKNFIYENNIDNSKIKISKLQNDYNIIKDQISKIKFTYNNLIKKRYYTDNVGKYIFLGEENLKDIKDQYDSLLIKSSNLQKSLNDETDKIFSTTSFKKLNKYILENKKSINYDYSGNLIVFKLKKIIVAFLFLLPLIYLFFRLMIYFKKRSYINFLVFKSLLQIILIPILIAVLFKFIYFLYSKISFDVFKNIIYSSENWFIDYYLVISILIVVFTFVISKIQAKHERKIKRYEKVSSKNYYGEVFKTNKKINLNQCEN